MNDWLFHWRGWLYENGCALLLLPYSDGDISIDDAGISNEVLSGVAVLRGSAGACRYFVRHWRNTYGSAGGMAIDLDISSDEWVARLNREADDIPAGDRDAVLLEHGAAAGLAPGATDTWTIAQDAEDLYRQAETATAATVVFAYLDRNDLLPLARRLHALRYKRGRALKLLVRIVSGVLRSQDHDLLLNAGGTLVLPRSAGPAEILHLIDLVQGLRYERSLTEDIESLLASVQSAALLGIVASDVFLEHVVRMVSNRSALMPIGLLLTLVPVRGLRAYDTLSQLRLRRGGDAACVLGGKIHLFLAHVVESGVEQAVARIFRMDHRTLFAEYRVVAERGAILARIAELRACPNLDSDMAAIPLPEADNTENDMKHQFRPQLLAAVGSPHDER